MQFFHFTKVVFLRIHFQITMKTALVAAIALACVLGLAMGFGYSSYGVQAQSGGFGGRKYILFRWCPNERVCAIFL